MRSELTRLGQLFCFRARHVELSEHYRARGQRELAERHRLVVVHLEQRIRARITL